MCKKENDLTRKQQNPAQSQYKILEAFMINFLLMIFFDLKQGLPTDIAKTLLERKKNY